MLPLIEPDDQWQLDASGEAPAEAWMLGGNEWASMPGPFGVGLENGPVAVQTAYPSGGRILGQFQGRLANGGETLRLLAAVAPSSQRSPTAMTTQGARYRSALASWRPEHVQWPSQGNTFAVHLIVLAAQKRPGSTLHAEAEFLVFSSRAIRSRKRHATPCRPPIPPRHFPARRSE